MRRGTAAGWVWFPRTRTRGTCRPFRFRASADAAAPARPPLSPREARGLQREHRLSTPALRCRTPPTAPTPRPVAQPCTVDPRRRLPGGERRRGGRDLHVAPGRPGGLLRVHRRGGRPLPRAAL